LELPPPRSQIVYAALHDVSSIQARGKICQAFHPQLFVSLRVIASKETAMSRPIIICPSCHRELYHLHLPQCSWCGADIPEEEFEKVALPPGELPTPDLPPIPPLPLMGTSWMGRSTQPFMIKPFIFQPASPWKRKLKIAFSAIIMCLLLARLADFIYTLWQVHSFLPLH
jgi:hypothetical protein